MTTQLHNGEITVNGEADYELEIKRIVDKILSTQTGQAIATKIQAHGEVLIDEDYPGTNRGEVNSEFDPGRSGKNRGVIAFNPHSKKLTTLRVFFNRQEITIARLRDIQQHFTGQRPDDILFHELVHAARYLGGDFKKTPMPGYGDEEEYFAILVTNIYNSERGRSFESYRKSHGLRRKPEMTEEEAEPMAFLLEDDNYRLIEKFWKQHPTIAPMIARAPAEFNPIRDYDDLKQRRLPRFTKEKYKSPPLPITQYEPRVPVTDSYLLTLLEPRYRADDVVGYGGRARKLELVFGHMPSQEALLLLPRLLARPQGDNVAMYFHDHLATATRKKLVDVLVGGLGRPPR